MIGVVIRFKKTGGTVDRIEDRQLTEHYRLFDLLRTDHADLLTMNHQIDELQVAKLIQVAMLVEVAWGLIGAPLRISSAYRCPALNKAVGSSDRSQHLLCEAADAVPSGMEVLDAFKKLRVAAKERKIKFGQMIFEQASRGYAGGTVAWIHLSLGYPYRAADRCGQILTMNDGAYNLLETIRD